MKKEWFTVKKLYSNIWGIGEFEHNEKVISYLFVGKKRALLFDSGMGIKNIALEVRKITNLPVLVTNSHSHYDHIGGNNLFSEIMHLKRGEKITVDPFSFKAIHTPGHTPDSVCLYEQSHKLLLTGDTLYPGPIYLHLPDSDLKRYLQSIRKLAKIKTIKDIFPGHNNFSMRPSSIKTIMSKVTELEDKSYVKIDGVTSIRLK